MSAPLSGEHFVTPRTGKALRAVVVGRGRMGRAVAAALERRGHQVIALLGRNDGLAAAEGADIAFEFTVATAAPHHVGWLVGLGVPTVSGTTGWDGDAARAWANERRVPLLVEPNYSLGVAVMRRLVREAAARLLTLPEFDCGVFERHHQRKRDAPSGTALALCAVARQASGRKVDAVALRLGEQPGEHQVLFEGPDETLEIVHRARSRRLFAAGAVRAGEWLLARRPPGAVRLDDLLDGMEGPTREGSR
jgi:4-hydroxy-tetrahydrodipicolinate reductase